jgi:hypothetical protein
VLKTVRSAENNINLIISGLKTNRAKCKISDEKEPISLGQFLGHLK